MPEVYVDGLNVQSIQYTAQKSQEMQTTEPTEDVNNIAWENNYGSALYKRALLTVAGRRKFVSDVGLVANPVITKRASDEREAMYRQFLMAASEKDKFVSDAGFIARPIIIRGSPPPQKPQDANVLSHPYAGYEQYYMGRYSLLKGLDLGDRGTTPPQVRGRVKGVGDVDTDTVVRRALENYQRNKDSLITASGVIFKKLNLENRPYTGSPDDRWGRLKWAVKETLVDVAQGAIATVTFPVDAILVATQRDKLKGISFSDVKQAVWESAKSGELFGELAGGLLVSGAIGAVKKGIAGIGTRSGASGVSQFSDDVLKTGVKDNIDDLTIRATRVTDVSDDVMLKFSLKGPPEHSIPPGAKTYLYKTTAKLDLGDVKIERYPGYLRIQAKGKVGEIYAKGGTLDIRGELWRDKGLLKYVDEKLSLYAPDERVAIKPTLDEFMEIKWISSPQKQGVIQEFLDEWKGFVEARETAIYNPEKWQRYGWLYRPTAQQKLLLKEAKKEVIYVDAPPEWKAFKASLRKAGLDTVDAAIISGASWGATNLAIQRFSRKHTKVIVLPQIPESLQRLSGDGTVGGQKLDHGFEVKTQLEIIKPIEPMASAEVGITPIKVEAPQQEITQQEIIQEQGQGLIQQEISQIQTFDIPTAQLQATGSPSPTPTKQLTFAGFAVSTAVSTKAALKLPTPRPKLLLKGGYAERPPKRYSLWDQWVKRLGTFNFTVRDVEKKMGALNEMFRGFKL